MNKKKASSLPTLQILHGKKSNKNVHRRIMCIVKSFAFRIMWKSVEISSSQHSEDQRSFNLFSSTYVKLYGAYTLWAFIALIWLNSNWTMQANAIFLHLSCLVFIQYIFFIAINAFFQVLWLYCGSLCMLEPPSQKWRWVDQKGIQVLNGQAMYRFAGILIEPNDFLVNRSFEGGK